MSPSTKLKYDEDGNFVGNQGADTPDDAKSVTAGDDEDTNDEYTEMDYSELVEAAKEAGVGKHGDKRVDLEAALRAYDAEDDDE